MESVRAQPKRLAAFSPSAAETSAALKQFLNAKVYTSPVLQDDRRRSMAMIGELFQFFLDRPDRMPSAYALESAQEPPHRVICGYLAGMTDVFFHRTYEQLLGTAGQSSTEVKFESSTSRTP